jgi:hypothetical protein
MTERGFNFWTQLDGLIPNIWEKPVSSTGKYHGKADGRIPTIAEHTYEMLYAGIKIWDMLGKVKNTSYGDVILLSIVLHDRVKYGNDGKRGYCTPKHDSLMADLLKTNKGIVKQLLTDGEFEILEEAIRYHQGRWSSESRQTFHFSQFNPETMFLHTLDMLSFKDVIKAS